MGNSRYDKYSKINTLTKTYAFTTYPQVSLNEIDFFKITVTSSDRLDILAKRYFGNSKLWWIIAMINNIPGDSIMVEVGTQLYIPMEYYIYV